MAIAPTQVRQVFGEALWSAFAHLFMRGSLVVAFMMFSHSLPADNFAALNEFNLSISYLSAMMVFGLGPTTVRHFSNEANRSEGKSLGSVYLYFSLSLFSSIILSYYFAPKNIGGAGTGIFAFLMAVVILGVFPNSALNGFRRYPQTAFAAGVAAVVLLLAAALTKTLLFAVVAVASAYLVKALVESVILFRSEYYSKFEFSIPDKQSLIGVGSSLLKIGSAAILAAGGLFAMTKILRDDISVTAFSEFAIGMQWYAIGAFAAANVTRVLLPRQVALAAQNGGNASGQRVLLLQGIIIGTAGAGVLVALSLLAQPFLGILYGSAAGAIENTIPLFLLAALTAVPVNMVGNVAVAHHREGVWLVATLFGVLAMLGTLLVVSLDGPLRGALALMVCNLLQTGICVAILMKEKLL